MQVSSHEDGTICTTFCGAHEWPSLTLETRVSGKRHNQLKRRQAFECAEMDFRQFFEL